MKALAVEKPALSSVETAKRLSVSPLHVRRLIQTGKLRAIDVGAATTPQWRISIEAIEEFEKRRTSGP